MNPDKLNEIAEKWLREAIDWTDGTPPHQRMLGAFKSAILEATGELSKEVEQCRRSDIERRKQSEGVKICYHD